MDFQRRKLLVAVWILVGGMVASLIYHGWEGWGLGRSYPDNTFLFYPEARYSDFVNTYYAALSGAPYRDTVGGSAYFPATYHIYSLFAWLPPTDAAVLFLGICSAGLFVVLESALASIIRQPGWRMAAAIVFLWTYPLLMALDRGANEVLLVLLVAGSLLFYSRKRFVLSFWTLFPAICFKLYPAILLLLFCRRRMFHWCFIAVVGFLLVTWFSMLIFSDTLTDSWTFWSQQFAFYTQTTVFDGRGIAASASAWNPFRIVIWMVYFQVHHHPDFVAQLPLSVSQDALILYSGLSFVSISLLTLYVLLSETTFPRRAIVLLLFITVSAPGGGDYKLMYVAIALIILILTPQRRPGDMVVTVLLAICLLPKREFLLHFMGISDSGKYDSNIGVILNPLCMLSALFLLVWSGWRCTQPLRLKQRFGKFLGFFHFPALRPMWTALQPAFGSPLHRTSGARKVHVSTQNKRGNRPRRVRNPGNK